MLLLSRRRAIVLSSFAFIRNLIGPQAIAEERLGREVLSLQSATQVSPLSDAQGESVIHNLAGSLTATQSIAA